MQSRQPRIIDGFIFYNELDMLEYRLSIMYPHVDAFVLVESTRTHKGTLKPLYYQDNKERYAKYTDKIIHVVVDDLYSKPVIDVSFIKGEQWVNEKHQRDGISLGIELLAKEDEKRGWKLKEEDILFISDVDEIIDMSRVNIIQTALKTTESNGLVILPMDMYYYNLKNKFSETWIHAKAITYSYYLTIPKTNYVDMKEFRNISEKVRLFHSGFLHGILGWHLSYFGNENMISNKLKEFAHQEFNSSIFTNPKYIKERIEKSMDILGRSNVKLQKLEITENPYLPPPFSEVEKGFPFSL